MKKLSLAVMCFSAVASVNAMAASKDVKHIAGVFLGATKIKGETDFSYGFEYEYKINQQWGFGPLIEKTNDAKKGKGVTVKLLNAYYHPIPEVRLGIGWGEEEIGGKYPHTENLWRASAAYDFHIGDFGIAPTVAIDFVDGERNQIFGIAIVKSF